MPLVEKSTPRPPQLRPTRRRVRARSVPVLPTALWIVLGLAIVIWGFWNLGSRDEAVDAAPVISSSPTAAAPLALTDEPVEGADLPTAGPSAEAVLEATPEANAAAQVTASGSLPPRAGTSATGSTSASVGFPKLIRRGGESGGGPDFYTVAPGDTLSSIAGQAGMPLERLLALNGISDPNMVFVGQVLAISAGAIHEAPFQRLLPDSELILSPAYQDFDLPGFVEDQGGFLLTYREEVEGDDLTGAEVVDRVSQRFSVGPRPLLAILEYHSGWVTQTDPVEQEFPLGVREPHQGGLFRQLSWAANRMNEGYYGQYLQREFILRFKDGTRAELNPQTNPGTVAIQNVFAVNGDPDRWTVALSDDGFYATYRAMFGNPWAREITPLVPEDLAQPELRLPWPSGESWYFTGGPHGGWGNLSAWAALDFVPPDNTGCAPSSYMATAVAAGKVIRSEQGEVVIDLDGDGFVGTGWSILYMHIATDGRAAVGRQLAAGDAVGRPSCEGGFSDAAHLHIARRYNGQWIEADGDIPFVLDGWRAVAAPQAYNGYLRRGGDQREACACRVDSFNGLTAR
jgi:LasA protease